MTHLIIDRDKCIGCGRCSSVCIRDNLALGEDRKIHETGSPTCFDCGHCLAVCPKGAIRLQAYPNSEDRIREYDPKERVISESQMLDFLQRRRSCRWFTDQKVTREEFTRLFAAAYYSPTGQNAQDVEIAVIDGRLDEFMHLVGSIIAAERETYFRVDQFCRYLEDPTPFKHHPLLWESRQIVCTFADTPADALIAATRMELLGYTMGLGGYYSLFMIDADRLDHAKLMTFFPDIPPTKHLQAVYVIGHPRISYRRTVPRRAPPVHWD